MPKHFGPKPEFVKTFTPEKLNLWDRFFNRYRKIVIEEGKENWYKTYNGIKIPNSDYSEDFVKYKIIDRLTGSETIKKEFLN